MFFNIFPYHPTLGEQVWSRSFFLRARKKINPSDWGIMNLKVVCCSFNIKGTHKNATLYIQTSFVKVVMETTAEIEKKERIVFSCDIVEISKISSSTFQGQQFRSLGVLEFWGLVLGRFGKAKLDSLLKSKTNHPKFQRCCYTYKHMLCLREHAGGDSLHTSSQWILVCTCIVQWQDHREQAVNRMDHTHILDKILLEFLGSQCSRGNTYKLQNWNQKSSFKNSWEKNGFLGRNSHKNIGTNRLFLLEQQALHNVTGLHAHSYVIFFSC